ADVAAIEKLLAGVSANSDSFDVDPEEHAKTIERLAAGRGAMTIVGTPEQVVASLLELTNAGLDGVAISWVDYDEGLQQMEDDILPLMIQAGLRS
ncbi:hypothetical protein AB4074_23480, partial [Arthrobacter sp. 2MCAF14]